MDERYPIGESESVSVAVLRHGAGEGYAQWSVAVGLRGGEATVHVPGHYPAVLAGRVRGQRPLASRRERDSVATSTST